MEQAIFPWWLVMLVGLWTAGLTCWLNERCSPSLRSYAGWCCLAYTALLWIVLSAGSSVEVGETDDASRLWTLRILATLALTSAFGLIGPVSPRLRGIALIVFGLSSGGVCLCLGKPVLAGVCLATAGLAMIRDLWTVRHHVVTVDAAENSAAEPSHAWLIGLACGVFALGLLGAFRWTMSVEFTQPTSSRQLPHKPSAPEELSESDWLQRHPEFPWLAAGLLVTTLVLWEAQRPVGSCDH